MKDNSDPHHVSANHTDEGVTSAVEELEAAMDAGIWQLLSPDGRLWRAPGLPEIFAAIAEILGEEPHHPLH